jgi:hypothetical protein
MLSSWNWRYLSFGFGGIGFYGNHLSQQADTDAKMLVENKIKIQESNFLVKNAPTNPFMVEFANNSDTAILNVWLCDGDKRMYYENKKDLIFRRIINPSFSFNNLLPANENVFYESNNNVSSHIFDNGYNLQQAIKEYCPSYFPPYLPQSSMFYAVIRKFDKFVNMIVSKSSNNSYVYYAVGEPKQIAKNYFEYKKNLGSSLRVIGFTGFLTCMGLSFV